MTRKELEDLIDPQKIKEPEDWLQQQYFKRTGRRIYRTKKIVDVNRGIDYVDLDAGLLIDGKAYVDTIMFQWQNGYASLAHPWSLHSESGYIIAYDANNPLSMLKSYIFLPMPQFRTQFFTSQAAANTALYHLWSTLGFEENGELKFKKHMTDEEFKSECSVLSEKLIPFLNKGCYIELFKRIDNGSVQWKFYIRKPK